MYISSKEYNLLPSTKSPLRNHSRFKKFRVGGLFFALLITVFTCHFILFSYHIEQESKPIINSLSYDPSRSSWIPIPYPTTISEKLLNQLNSDWKSSHGGFNFQSKDFPVYKPSCKLRSNLSRHFPYNASTPIPKLIWQTWKLRLSDSKFPKKVSNRIQSWINNNPNYTHTLFSDADMKTFVENEFANIPQVVDAFNLMPKPVLKADFFRYLIIFVKGGVYTDIDTINLKPIDSWVSLKSTVYDQPNNPGLVVGLEADIPKISWVKNFARCLQFVQWTLQGKPGHPILLELIAHITEITINRAKNNQLLTVLGKSASDDVMNWTGPGIWSDEILKYLNKLFQNQAYLINENWDEFNEYFNQNSLGGFSQPIIIHDVALLPLTSFCPEANGGGKVTEPLAYVKHCFDGSWKNHKLIG